MKNFLHSLSVKKKAAAVLAAVAVLVMLWQLYKSITYKPPQETYVPVVRTAVAEAGFATPSGVYSGEVRGRYESAHAFQASGRINRRFVNVGDKVAKGQVLMTIDPRDILQDVEAAEAAFASAASAARLAEANAKRYSSLYESGATSRLVYDEYVNQLAAAQAALREAQAALVASRNQLAYTELLSDGDGVIAEITAEVGQVVAAGTAVATVVRSSDWEIKADIPENVCLEIGQKASVSFWAMENMLVEGYVREISPMADSATRTYKIAVAVPALPAEVKLGMTAKVTFTKGEQKKILIPAEAVYSVNAEHFVWRLQDKHVKLQAVEISGYAGRRVIVESGLSEGDTVVTAGLAKLIDGMEVLRGEGGV